MNILHSLFPKFFGHLDPEGLAATIRDCGLDTVDLVIRKGFWVTGEDLQTEVPAFLAAMKAEGIEVPFATAGFEAEAIAADPTPVQVLADHGIRTFRMGYFRKGFVEDPAEGFKKARGQMEEAARVLERIGAKAVYQIHHGTLAPSPSAIHRIVEGLPPEHIGVMIDPGNQAWEGREDSGRSARLLGAYLVAVGAKDTVPVRDEARAGEEDKGWTRRWAPCDKGVTNWAKLARALRQIGFDGIFNWQPFYDEKQPDLMAAKLKREVAYVRGVIETVEAEAEA